MPDHPKIELCPVDRVDRGDLYRLVDRYLVELTAHREHPVGPADARSYKYLPLYWEEPGRHPLFVASQAERVGFVLIREVTRDATIQMSDFYIRPDARRTGCGRAAVAEVWRRFPGSWELQVHPLNEAASAFWRGCIGQCASGRVEIREVIEEDGRRVQYNFEIAAAQQGTAAERQVR